MTAVVLNELSTADNVVDPFNDWVAYELLLKASNVIFFYFTAPRISPALFAMNYEFMLGAKDKPLNVGLR